MNIHTRSKDSIVFFELNDKSRLHEVSQPEPNHLNEAASKALSVEEILAESSSLMDRVIRLINENDKLNEHDKLTQWNNIKEASSRSIKLISQTLDKFYKTDQIRDTSLEFKLFYSKGFLSFYKDDKGDIDQAITYLERATQIKMSAKECKCSAFCGLGKALIKRNQGNDVDEGIKSIAEAVNQTKDCIKHKEELPKYQKYYEKVMAQKEALDKSNLGQMASLALSSSVSEPAIKNRTNIDYHVKEIVRTKNDLPLKIKLGKRKKHTIEEENNATQLLIELAVHSKSNALQQTQVAAAPDLTRTNEAGSINNSMQVQPLFSKQPRSKPARRYIRDQGSPTEPSQDSRTPDLDLTNKKPKETEAQSSTATESSNASKKAEPNYLFTVRVLNDKIYSIMPLDPVDYFKKAGRRFKLNSITDTSTNKEYFLDQFLTKSEQSELLKSNNLNLSYEKPKLPFGARLLPKDWLEQMCKRLEQG